MDRRSKIIVSVLLCIVCLSILSLTIFRPTTAKVYHKLLQSYTEANAQADVNKLYQYTPESSETTDLTDVRLPEALPLSNEEEILYMDTVGQLLQEDLWNKRDMYDASNYLMVPMHYAFRSGDIEKIEAFHRFFARWFESINGDDVYAFSEQPASVNIFQFYYFCCEYLRLCSISGELSSVPDGFYDFLYCQVEYQYTEVPGNWNSEKNYLSRAEQILLHKEYPYHYYSALTDMDLFPLAALCDLRIVSQFTGEGHTELLDRAAMLAYRMYTDMTLVTETEKGGYLFQVGVWRDHKDYAYAGNVEITKNIQPCIREDIVSDSSHFIRHALWLTSFQQAQIYQEQYDLFQLRREELANQLINYVIQYVDGKPLATTFMDGTFGVYRYSYNTEGVGHQGYSLSGTLLLGWWSFLDDSRITKVYENILAQFPMSAGVENPYFDYATTREQNRFFDADTAFDNGMMECMVMLAAKLGVE